MSPTPDDVTAGPAPIPRRSADSAHSAVSPSAGSWSGPPPEAPSRAARGVPEGADAPQEPDEPAPGTWRKVEKAAVPSPQQPPATATPPPHRRRPMPRRVIVLGVVVTVALVVVAGWLGSLLAGPGGGTPVPTATTWALEPPQLVGDLVRGEVTRTTDPADPARAIVRTDYTDGTTKVVLILSRPETDLGTFLTDAGVTDTSDHASARCGTSSDTKSPVCAMITDDTGLMLVGLSGQEPGTLAKQLFDFHDSLTQ